MNNYKEVAETLSEGDEFVSKITKSHQISEDFMLSKHSELDEKPSLQETLEQERLQNHTV